MEVRYLPEAEQERDKLPAAERAALYNAVRKLEALGPDLGYPQPAMSAERAGCGNCGRGKAAARGGRFTGRPAATSSSLRWARKRKAIRGASGGPARPRSSG